MLGTDEFFTEFTDLSFEASCGTLLGFTEDEVRRFYPTHLQKARAALNLSEDDLLQRLVRHYGGYRFDEKREPGVINPWSLLNFLQSPKRGFQPYWGETGGLVSGLRRYLTNPVLRDPAKFGETVTLSKSLLIAETTNESAGGSVLLTQTGYLTVKNFLNGNFEFGYPNREVADSMASLYSELLLSGKQLDDVDAGAIDEVLAEGADGDVVEQFNRIFAALDYLNYPVTNESVCRGYFFVLLQGAQLYAKLEVHNAYGHSDLEVDAGDRHWVFELKFLAKTDHASDEKAAKLLAEAAEQMRSKHYGEEDRSGRELKRLALVFSEEKRQFTAWQAV